MAADDPPFPVGAEVRVASGRFAGRGGKVVRVPTAAFRDFRRVELTPAPRERVRKVEFLAVADLRPAPSGGGT